MLDHGISGLPVVNSDSKVIGILTEGDLLRRAETGTERQRPRWLEVLLGPGRLAGEYVRTHGRRVGEITTEDVVSVAEDTPLVEIVRLLEGRSVNDCRCSAVTPSSASSPAPISCELSLS